jgi:hypothetical protein
MKTAFLLLSLVLVISIVGVRPAAAEEAASPSPPASEGPAVDAPTPTPLDAGEPAFVDRDGDGLQDGQEHRFRGRWRGLGGKGGLGEGRMERRGGGNGPRDGESGGGRQQRGNP